MFSSRKPIGTLVEEVHSWNPARDAAGKIIQYIDLSSIDATKKSIVFSASIAASTAPSRARQLVRRGDVLVSTVRPNLNGVAQVSSEFDGATASTGFCVLRPNPSALESSYLFHWVRTPAFVAYLTGRATGASYPAVNDRIIFESTIPLPPLDEQRRIAAILDQADNLRRKRRLAMEKINALGRSFFDHTRHEALAAHCPVLAIEEFCETGSGTTPSRANANAFYGGGIPWVKSGELREEDISTTEETVTELALTSTSLKVVPAGAILLAMYGATIGRVGFLRIPATTNQAVCQIIPDSRIADTTYVYYAVQGLGSAFIARAAGGAQPNINQQIVRKATIVLPDMEKQRQFAQRIADLDRLRAQLRVSASALDHLFASLQDHAFVGSLSSPAAAPPLASWQPDAAPRAV